MSTNFPDIIRSQEAQFVAVLSDPGIEFKRESEFAMQVIEQNTYLTGICRQNPTSLRNAILNIAAIGISLNPAQKLAYLVPRDGKVCLDISYMGMMHLAQQTGAIQWGQAVLVREGDEFVLRGIAQEPLHKYSPFDPERNSRPVVGVYIVVKTDTGDFLTHPMSIQSVYDIRDRSSAWKAWIEKKKKCPWVTDEGEMIKKTCVKQAAKYWPRRDRLDQAVHHLNTDGGEGMQLAGEERDVTPITEDQITAITDKLAEIKKEWPALAIAASSLFKRTITNMDDLTMDEGVRVLAFIERKAA